MGEIMLNCENMCKHFGNLKAVNDVSITVKKGTVSSLIGPNGAGKSTTLNLITRTLNLSSGKVFFKDKDISREPVWRLHELGISRTYQHVHLFDQNDLTVIDNVKIGMHSRSQTGFLLGGFGLGKARIEEKEITAKAEEILNFLNIYHLRNEKVNSLAFGNQRMVELGRALISDPELLILDEPAAGLNDVETENLTDILKQFRKQGITVLLVEHHMGLVMDVSDSVFVLNYGSMLTNGTPEQVQNDPNVIEAYLGKGEVDGAETGSD